MSTASEWSSVIVGGVQFAAGIGVAYVTLRSQHDENIAQRDGNWFHLVVADKTVKALHKLTEIETRELTNSANRCLQLIASSSPRPMIDSTFRSEIQAFRSRLKPIHQKIANYAFIFDGDLHKRVEEQLEDLEDNVCGWFDGLQSGHGSSRGGDLIDTLCGSQREILRSFRDFEFIELPRQHASSRRHFATRVLFGASFILASLAWLFRWLHTTVAFTVNETPHAYQLDKLPALVSLGLAIVLLGWALAIALSASRRLHHS